MSNFHNLEIYPNDNVFISIEEINATLDTLIESKLVLNSVKIYKGETEDVKNISLWNFNNKQKFADELKESSNLSSELERNNLNRESNYVFVVEINLENDVFSDLNAKILTELNSFPFFLIYLNSGFEFKSYHVDESTEQFVEINRANINCLIKSSGPGNDNLYGLGEKAENYESFYEIIKPKFQGLTIANYYD